MSNTSRSVNYARAKSHWGAIPGTIQIHTVEGLGQSNDPTTAKFKETIPGGFLRCNGQILAAKDYPLLASILGIGDECRFAKEDAVLRNPDPETDDQGTFQLPDLGSKVLVGSRGSGEYRNTVTDTNNQLPKVGVEATPLSNLGGRISTNYISSDGQFGLELVSRDGTQTDADGEAIPQLDFRGSIKYNMPSNSGQTLLTIDNFQAHAHNTSNKYVLNYVTQHAVDGDGLTGSFSTAFTAVPQAANNLDEVQANVFRGSASHGHRITRPFTYNSNYTYQFPPDGQPKVRSALDGLESYIDVDTEDLEVLNQVVTPFILVHYIIKF